MSLSNETINQLMTMGTKNATNAAAPVIDKLKLKAAIKNISTEQLQGFIQKAREQGISDGDIEKGLNVLLSL